MFEPMFDCLNHCMNDLYESDAAVVVAVVVVAVVVAAVVAAMVVVAAVVAAVGAVAVVAVAVTCVAPIAILTQLFVHFCKPNSFEAMVLTFEQKHLFAKASLVATNCLQWTKLWMDDLWWANQFKATSYLGVTKRKGDCGNWIYATAWVFLHRLNERRERTSIWTDRQHWTMTMGDEKTGDVIECVLACKILFPKYRKISRAFCKVCEFIHDYVHEVDPQWNHDREWYVQKLLEVVTENEELIHEC